MNKIENLIKQICHAEWKIDRVSSEKFFCREKSNKSA